MPSNRLILGDTCPIRGNRVWNVGKTVIDEPFLLLFQGETIVIQIGPDYLRVYSELLSREYRYIKIYDVGVCLVRILPGKGFVSLPVSLGIGMSITKKFWL